MPRQAHGRPVNASGPVRPAKRKPAKGQFHNALEIAEKQNPIRTKIQPHRLGDVEEDSAQPQYRADVDGRSYKRRKIADESDSDEELVGGSDSDGNQWHVGLNDEDEDSDIDSDEAFGESDEERFSGYTFRGSTTDKPSVMTKRTKSRKQSEPPVVDLLEGEEGAELDGNSELDEEYKEDEEDLGEDAVDLATALDLNEEEERQEKAKQKRRSRRPAKEEEASSSEDDLSDPEGDGSEKATEEDEESQLSFSGEEDNSGHSKLRDFLEGLGATQNGASDSANSGARKPVANGPSSSKLTAADLLQYVKDPRQRQSLKVLNSSEKTGPERYQGGIPGKLEPPIAKRQQDRLDRVAAYDKSKETLDRWIETVKQNRRAEHISFPLKNPNNALSASGATYLVPTSTSQPITTLESSIQHILQGTGLNSRNGPSADQQEQAFEELQEKKMPIEEIQARRAELRQARELMFREEIRARRIKRIKSKAYRRVHRKERDKVALEERAYLASAGLLNSDEEREQNDRIRAEERMGARHRESRWAKAVKSSGRAAWDEDARHAVSDLARREDELRKRIEGKTVHNSDQSDQEPTSDSDDESSSAGDDNFNGFDEKITLLEQKPLPQKMSRLGSMAFMQKAEAARTAANDAELRGLRQTIHGYADGDKQEGVESTGRLRFGAPKDKQHETAWSRTDKKEFEGRLSDDEEAEGEPATTLGRASKPSGTTRSNLPGEKKQLPQPGLASAGNTVTETARLSSQEQPQKQPHGRSSNTRQTIDDVTSDSGSGSDDGAPLDLNDNAALAKSLFAGDDIVREDFVKEKKETIDDEGDQVIDNSLPGWGSWTGSGISKREQRRSKGRFVTMIKGVSEEQRKDAKLERVIINEKRVKKNGKYLATELPHPFESRQQYERSLRLPIGPEWTTKSTFQDATKPRVLTKQGIIRPIAKPIA